MVKLAMHAASFMLSTVIIYLILGRDAFMYIVSGVWYFVSVMFQAFLTVSLDVLHSVMGVGL